MFSIRIIAEFPENTSTRKINSVTRATRADCILLWHRTMLPHHFHPYSRFRYQMQPRSAEYEKTKQRLAKAGKVKKGGKVYLVFSGALEAYLKRTIHIRIFPSRATGYMYGPQPYAKMRPYKSGRPNLGAEATRVIPAEARQLVAHAQSRTNHYLSQRKLPPRRTHIQG